MAKFSLALVFMMGIFVGAVSASTLNSKVFAQETIVKSILESHTQQQAY